jgi:hypothetical protein
MTASTLGLMFMEFLRKEDISCRQPVLDFENHVGQEHVIHAGDASTRNSKRRVLARNSIDINIFGRLVKIASLKKPNFYVWNRRLRRQAAGLGHPA